MHQMKIYSNYNAINKFIYGFVENICAIICIYNAAFAIPLVLIILFLSWINNPMCSFHIA